MSFTPIRIRRRTAETTFEVVLRPRVNAIATVPLPNQVLSHFLDHLFKATGVEVELGQTAFSGSWAFDHVLCEDMGQLIGRGFAELCARRADTIGVAGRSSVVCCMDDAQVEVCLSIEGRPQVEWIDADDIDGFVDAWYVGSEKEQAVAYGTNLRQFFDGFSIGAGATLIITVRRAGNLHHFYEALFRGLGDALAEAIGSQARLPGDTSGLAGSAVYEVEDV